jgi:hypothetical protein
MIFFCKYYKNLVNVSVKNPCPAVITRKMRIPKKTCAYHVARRGGAIVSTENART